MAIDHNPRKGVADMPPVLDPPRPPKLTFERWHRATADLSDAQRCNLFEHVMPEESADCWKRLSEELEGARVDDVTTAKRPKLQWSQPERIALSSGSFDRYREDVLETVSPVEYVHALTGEQPPERGGAIRCPLPGHDDRTPSCHVYAEPGRGWYCHGCHRGGGAVDLAAYLTGIEPRGSGYIELRKMVAEKLLVTS